METSPDPCERGATMSATERNGMYARTSTWAGTPEALEKWAGHVQEKVGPMVAGLSGNAGAYFFIDREGNSALTLTIWESEEAALASDQTAEKSRESTVAATRVTCRDVSLRPGPDRAAGGGPAADPSRGSGRRDLVGAGRSGHPPVHAGIPRGNPGRLRPLLRRERVSARRRQQ